VPGDRHAVSANASETQPARLLAVFVVDTNETELTIHSGTEVRYLSCGDIAGMLQQGWKKRRQRHGENLP